MMMCTRVAVWTGLILGGHLASAADPNTLAFDPNTGWASLFDGQSLGSWRVTDFLGTGSVSVHEGVIALDRGHDLTGITWSGPLLRRNYEIELQARRTEGTDFFCGLTVPIGKEYLTLVCGGWGGDLVGISCVDFYDAANNLTCTSHRFESKRWYTIRLRVTDFRVQAWIDDELLVDQETEGHGFNVRFEVEPSRPLGVATWQTAAELRRIHIRRVQALRPFEPTASYTPETVEGWRVRVSETLHVEYPTLTRETLRLLQDHLYRVTQVVPEKPLAELRKVPIWVEYRDRDQRCMCYHPSEVWLTENGYNPDKAASIEIGRAENFLAWSNDQPWMVLHELAHAYHHRVLGHDFAPLQEAFAAARESGTYDQVLHIAGKTRRHYALNNVKEYFAEGTEAFLGTNDFYPFVRAELRQHDPRLYRVLEAIWR